MIRILVPLDGSVVAEYSIHHALAIARSFPAEIVLLRVINEPDGAAITRADSVDLALWRYQAKSYLDRLRDKYLAEKIAIRNEVVIGRPAEVIVEAMTAAKPDLLILTRYGRGNAKNFSAGGTAQKIVASASCSVLLLDRGDPTASDGNYRRILVPIDDSKESDCAVAVATMIAEVHGASLLLLHVTEEPHLPTGLPVTRHILSLKSELLRVIRNEADRRLCELAANIPNDIRVATRVFVSANVPATIEATAKELDSDMVLLHTTDTGVGGPGAVNQSLIQICRRPLFILRPSAAEEFASNFRSVFLDEPLLEAG